MKSYHKKNIFLFLVLCIISCKDIKVIDNSENSTIVNSKRNENKLKVKKFDFEYNAKPVENFSENGLLKEKGNLLNDSIKVGLWSYFNDNKLILQKEFIYRDYSEFDYNGRSSYLNQSWVYDENKNIIGGSFYEINKIKKEYYLGSEIPIEIFTPYKYFEKLDSELFFIYTNDKQFNKGITNRDEIKYDTIWNVMKSYPSQLSEESESYKFYIKFKIIPQKVGIYTLNGILTEKGNDYSRHDSLIRYREIFMNISFMVKDTIK